MMSEVVDLVTRARLKPERNDVFCLHISVCVIEKTRMLECQNCGATISPFDYLWKIANKQNNATFENRHLSNQKRQLQDEVKELKRKKNNLASQVKRLEVKIKDN